MDRLTRLTALAEKANWDYQLLKRQFVELAMVSPNKAMDRLGLELAETEEFLLLVLYCSKRSEELPAIIEHQERCLLRGDWLPRSPCAMNNTLNQAKNLARCKLIQRLREMLLGENDD